MVYANGRQKIITNSYSAVSASSSEVQIISQALYATCIHITYQFASETSHVIITDHYSHSRVANNICKSKARLLTVIVVRRCVVIMRLELYCFCCLLHTQQVKCELGNTACTLVFSPHHHNRTIALATKNAGHMTRLMQADFDKLESNPRKYDKKSDIQLHVINSKHKPSNTRYYVKHTLVKATDLFKTIHNTTSFLVNITGLFWRISTNCP
jgi:hypothetical protein